MNNPFTLSRAAFAAVVAALLTGCASTEISRPLAPLPGIRRLDHYAVHVTDLARSAAFYERVFGFGIVNKWKTTWMVGNDRIRVGLFLRPKAAIVSDPDNKVLIEHVAFLTDERNFNRCIVGLDQLGIPHEPPEDTGIAKSVFFNDPDGHSLEITYYYQHIPKY